MARRKVILPNWTVTNEHSTDKELLESIFSGFTQGELVINTTSSITTLVTLDAKNEPTTFESTPIITKRLEALYEDAKSYTDNVTASAETAAKAYALEMAASADTSARLYADSLAVNYDVVGSAASAETAAKAYALEMAASADTSARLYADNKITNLNLPNTYAAKSLETTVSTLVGVDTSKSVRVIASEEVAKIVNSADTSYDTLKEIADWILNDTTGAAQMANDIETLKSFSADTRLDTLEEDKHSHNNKSLLDTYEQTEDNLKDAVEKKHTHSNKTVIDGITSAKVTSWDGAATNSHTHSNKTVIDGIDATKVTGWDGAATNSHTHSNKTVIDGVTSAKVMSWDGAATDSHTHDNKTVIDGVTSAKVMSWDGAATNSHTHSNSTALNSITDAKITNWDNTGVTLTSVTGKTYLIGYTAKTGTVRDLNTSTTDIYMEGGEVYAASDECLKNFGGNVEVDFEKLLSIPKVYYTWKNDNYGKNMIGTSAQKLKEIYPELVSENEDGKMAVSYEKLSIIALAAVDKLHKENEELKDRLKRIEEKLGL